MKIVLKIIKYSFLSITFGFVLIHFSLLIYALINKEDFKLTYKRITSELLPKEKKEEKPFQIYTPKTFSLLKPNQMLQSKILEQEFTLEEIQALKIEAVLKIKPDVYSKSLIADEEWKPLAPLGDERKHLADWQFPDWETHLRIYGQQKLGFSYGWSHYLVKPKYAYEVDPSSSAVVRGFKPSQSLEIHIQGKVGKKVTIEIDSSGRQDVDTYKVEYNALKKEEFIQRITAGNIGVSLPGSAYASGSSGGTKSAFGISALAQKGPWQFQAIASMTRGITEVKHFQGTSQLVVKNIGDIYYVPRKYYIINNGAQISPGSIKIYLDNNNGTDDTKTIPIKYFFDGLTNTKQFDLLFNGIDYTIDENRGILIFQRGITANDDVIITYNQASGANSLYIDPLLATNSIYRVIMTNQQDSRFYAYLQKTGSQVSPYEHKGVYSIGNQNIQKNDKDFRFFIIDKDLRPLASQPFSEINTANYFGPGGLGYYIDEVQGYIIFENPQPFLFPGSEYTKTTDALNNSFYKSGITGLTTPYYSIHMEYRYESRTFTLHWDIIPESEIVYLNGRKLSRDIDYTIDYKTGYVEFLSGKVTITPDSEIDIVYEYLPFGGGLQQILAGARVDYKPIDWFSLGTVGFYNGKQSPARVPSVNNASDNRWVGSLFGNVVFDDKYITKGVQLISPWRVKNVPAKLSFGGEYAASYYNINTFGQGMIDDFEGSIETASMEMRDISWYISRPPDYLGSSGYSTRAELRYKDYHDYNDNQRLKDINWSGTNPYAPYTVKPGPYDVNEGHLDPAQLSSVDEIQRSIVLDYNFSSGKNWAGIVYKNAFAAGGRDFRDYTDLVMWVKLVGDGKVNMHVDIGEFSEDIDNDGILDKETSKEEGGFTYNGPDATTAIGGGPKAYAGKDAGYLEGNGVVDSEDLDQNGILNNVKDQVIFLPTSGFGAVPYSITEKGDQNLVISNTGWQLIRITLDKSKLDTTQQDILKRIKHVRVVIESNQGATGKLIIQQMYFAGLVWKNMHLNESSVSVSTNFKAYMISTHNNEEYKRDSLRNYDKEKYDDLHGSITEEEWEQMEEQALVLDWKNLKQHDFSKTMASNSITTNYYTSGWVSRSFSQQMDLRYYKKLRFWVYVPPTQQLGDWVFIRFGGDINYYEFRKKITWTGWQQVEVDLRSSEFQDLRPRDNFEGKYLSESQQFRVKNIPSLKNVTSVVLGVYSGRMDSTGRIWINDVYLDDVDKRVGQAYNYNIGFDILNHLGLNYSHSFRDKDFSSIGGVGTGTESLSDSISGTWSTINWMPVNGSWSHSVSKSDVDDIWVPINEQGYSSSVNLSGGVGFNLPGNPLLKRLYPQYWPTFNVSGSLSSSSNAQPLSWLEDQRYLPTSLTKSHSYAWNGSMKVPLFDTLLASSLNWNLGRSFSESENRSMSYSKTNSDLQYLVKTNFSYSRSISWNVGGNYSTGSFSLSPSYSYSYALSKNKLQTNWMLNSRSRSISSGINIPKILIITPSLSYSLAYSESGFHYKGLPIETEYENYDKDPNLYKNATTSQSYSLGIGSFSMDWPILKSFSPSYNQSMGFSQSDISMSTNSMLQTWQKFTDPFLLQVPGRYFYIPYIYPHFRVFDFVRNFKDEKYQNSLSYNNAFSASSTLDFFSYSQWALSYSISQSAARSYSSYSIGHSWSASASSSLDLMKLFNFWIWRQNTEFVKSSSLSYGISYRRSNNFLQLSRDETYSPNFGFSYRWKADKSLSWSLSYSYTINQFEEFKNFYEILNKDYGEEDPEFVKNLKPTVNKYDPKIGETWKFNTGYSYTSDLAEYWKPPLFFKKPIRLGFKISHTTSFEFNRTTYDYGKDVSGNDAIHPKEMVHQFILNHSMSFTISKNIDGGGHARLAYEKTREEKGRPGDAEDDIEQIFSWEIGIDMTIRF